MISSRPMKIKNNKINNRNKTILDSEQTQKSSSKSCVHGRDFCVNDNPQNEIIRELRCFTLLKIKGISQLYSVRNLKNSAVISEKNKL